ncbi:hypothetical protein E2C01_061981 [Portunus trituberculatus]|uniref:Uncharacterized protein n=1 Tax=Portunus trituberculatus TaxID=210409 RepID=A0A5B7HEP4_PORTR|nr:hypothetical protein [Portunus trituberculatus]
MRNRSDGTGPKTRNRFQARRLRTVGTGTCPALPEPTVLTASTAATETHLPQLQPRIQDGQQTRGYF